MSKENFEQFKQLEEKEGYEKEREEITKKDEDII